MALGRIGVFDSGVGGLTIAGRLMEEAPHLGIHYFGDTAHVPYGGRPPEEVAMLVEQIVEYLVESGCSAVVMACNTSNAVALERVKSWCPVPVVGIIEPAARAAMAATRNGRIGVIANPITASSGAYERACAPTLQSRYGPSRNVSVYPVGCPKLVPLIEQGLVHSPQARAALMGYLGPLMEWNLDTLVFGCTHYPFLRDLIQDILGPSVTLIDPGAYVLAELTRLGVTETSTSEHLIEVSGAPAEFERGGTRLLGRLISGVRKVNLQVAEPVAV